MKPLIFHLQNVENFIYLIQFMYKNKVNLEVKKESGVKK